MSEPTAATPTDRPKRRRRKKLSAEQAAAFAAAVAVRQLDLIAWLSDGHRTDQ